MGESIVCGGLGVCPKCKNKMFSFQGDILEAHMPITCTNAECGYVTTIEEAVGAGMAAGGMGSMMGGGMPPGFPPRG